MTTDDTIAPPWVLSDQFQGVAVRLLQTYFGSSDRSPGFTGAHFETLGGAWDQPDQLDDITPADIVAVSTLSVEIPAATAISLLDQKRDEVRALLAQIPPDLELKDASDADIGSESPASKLWSLLRSHQGMGPTKTSKLMARKRPCLIPIYDSVVATELGLRDGFGQWKKTRALLQRPHGGLHDHLLALRREAGLPSLVTPLRVLDIVVWMHGKDRARSERIAVELGLGASLTDRTPRVSAAT